MNCSNKPLHPLRALCAAAIVIFSAVACTEVDYRLGRSILPVNQRMEARVKRFDTGVDTYLYRAPDGIASSRLGHGYLGKSSDADFGARTNSFAAQFLPSSYPTSYSSGTAYDNFGLDPIIDSVRLILTIDGNFGNTAMTQTFEVYELLPTIELTRDSTYYTDIPVDLHKGDRLFTFTHSGKGSVQKRLDPTPEGKDFLKRLISIDMEDFTNDTLFHEQFRGLYIAPKGDSEQTAAVYAANLAESGLQLYMRIHDTIDPWAIYDTTYCNFLFRDTDESGDGYTVPWGNVSVNRVDYDYTGSTLGALAGSDNFTDTLSTDPVQSRLYVQSMGGVAGFLRFSDDFIAELQTLQENDEGKQHDININQAMMYVPIDEGTDIVDALDGSITRLGSYTDLKHLVPIPDYLYSYEVQRQSQEKGYVLPYNGYLNRSNARYEFDITAFVQQLAKYGKPDDDAYRTFKLAPDVMGMFGFGQSVLKGDEISIRLTYTLIDGKKEQ